MEFYGSKATMLTLASPWSVLLPHIHKTIIVQHHRSIQTYYICQMFMVQVHWFKYYGYLYC